MSGSADTGAKTRQTPAKGKRAGGKGERAAAKGERAAAKGQAAAAKAARASVKRSRGAQKVGFTPIADEDSGEQRLGRLEQRVASLTDSVRELASAVELQLRGLRRMLLLDGEQLPFPQRLTARRSGVDSQTDEDGITLAILDEVGIGPRRFVEIGSGNNGGNTGFLARELGFSGLMVDALQSNVDFLGQVFSRARVTCVCTWVTATDVNTLVSDHGATGEIDVLSIDIDGNDIWVWEALTVCDPRVVVIEFNPSWGAERAVAVPYDPSFDRHDRKPIYYGASLAAIAAMGERKGYRLVATTPGGPNAFLIRDDVGEQVPALAPLDGWSQMTHILTKRLARDGTPGDPVAELFGYVEAEGLSLVEL